VGTIVILAGCFFGAVIFIAILVEKQKRKRLMVKYGDKDLVDALMAKKIWQGMSEEQLFDSWGKPVAIESHVYKTKTAQTFKYQQTGKNQFRERVRVENGYVVGWKQR
jgi:hypothetical protein